MCRCEQANLEVIMNVHTDPRVLGAVEAELNYLLPTAEKPRSYTFEPPPGEPWSNALPEPHIVTIRNARPILDSVDLDREGFALLQHRIAVKNFYDDDEVRAVY
jgi:hypothetical protein